MDLRDYFEVLRRYWTSIVTITFIAVAGAATLAAITQPTYTAKTSLLLSARGGDSTSDLLQGAGYAANQVQSYAQIATTPTVLQPVIDELALDTTPAELAASVTASIPINTAIIEISVVQTDPVRSATLAQAIAQQLVAAFENLSPKDTDGNLTVTAGIVTPAATPTETTDPNVALNLSGGLLVGLALGIGQAALRNSLDLSVRTDADIARATTHSVIARIPFDPGASAHPMVTQSDPQSQRAEAYRRLRTNLGFLQLGSAETSKSLVVTSSGPGEGRTTTALGVASALAQAGQSVLLVDGDLRHPQVAEYLGLEDSAGLTTVLTGQAQLESVVRAVQGDSLHVLTAGQIPPNPAELLLSDAMQTVLQTAAQRYEVVVIDAPPLLPVADAATLSTLADGTLVVVGTGAVTIPELRDAMASLDQAHGKTLGLVLNKTEARVDAG